MPGPLKWDLTNGIATDTPESLFNSGLDPAVEATQGRAFAEDLPTRNLNPSEAKVLAVAIKPEAGRTFCSTWDVTDYEGKPITVGFVARVLEEADDSGRDAVDLPGDELAQRPRRAPRRRRTTSASGSSTAWPSPACTARWST